MTARRALGLAAAASALTLTACGDSPSMTTPRSPEARTIAQNWWLLFWLAFGVYIIVMGLVVAAMLRRRRLPEGERLRRVDNRFIVIGGLIVPVVILGITAVETVRVANKLAPASASADAPVQIRVEGERWWWRVDYPDEGFATANEIHVPVDQPVDITLVSDNVIHSLWIPELNGKQDMIPGQVNHLRFTADTPGTYLGRCAEFCGIQHAHMEFVVVVDSLEDYEAWLDTNRADAAPPAGDEARQGKEIVETTSCAGCHSIRGTAADGDFGPDLTHVGSRTRLAAGAIDNTPDGMARWLDETQHLKEGALMPEIDLTDDQVAALVAYLEGLR
ncbi:MAG: cytochrome c oxidase subunit II [Ilumatobacteraceae bacterium]